MAIQYYMRAYNTSTLQYVDWVVNDQPDTTGVYAPGGNTHLTNITVNRTVQSKVNNFLKPIIEPTYITNVSYNNPQDGYLFHLNSYDWLNPVASDGPITIPAVGQPIGISVVRGASISPGVPTPANYASLFWEEGTQEWNFAFINSNGSIGAPLAVSMGPSIIDGYSLIDGYLVIIPAPNTPYANSGAIRLSNSESIVTRNAANTADVITLSTDGYNNVILGNTNQNVIIGGSAANTLLPLVASSNTTTIAGNLIVLGNTTTVESTTVDIVGRVIHANYSTTTPLSPPTMISGYSIHRGGQFYNDGYFQNDGAALIWIEGTQVITGSDGYWLTATITQDIDTVTQASLPNIVKMMTGGVYVASTAQPGLTTLPTVGGLRTQNNTTAVSARKSSLVSDLLLLSTSTDTIVHGDSSNTGQIFNISTGSSYTFEINGVPTYTITPNSSGTTTLQAAPTVTSVLYNQGDITTNSGFGAVTTLQAQNATGTSSFGGALILTSGTGTSGAGNVNINTGGITKVSINPTFITFNDTNTALTITPVSTGTTQITYYSTVTAAQINQAPTSLSSITGASFTIAAQSVLGTYGIGGSLFLNSGLGTLVDGYVHLQVDGIDVAAVEPADTLGHSKFVFFQGRRRHITQITNTYNITPSDDLIAIVGLSAPFTIFLPTFPFLGDAYEIKDTTGNAGTSNVTVNGNGTNIDGSSSFALAQPYAAATFTFTGTTWSVT